MPEAFTIADGQPFAEAVEYQKQKVNVPSKAWTDLLHGAHTRAFTVAGAQTEAIVADFRAAVDKAVADGTSLAEFRKDFDQIVERHGWSYNGGRGWRTRVIYTTNMRTSYMAGRYRQMTDPDVLRYRPYWQYNHGDSQNPRLQHLAWDGLVLAADDPFWSTHYPPNGWGCSCSVRPLSERQLKRLGKSAPDAPPPLNARPVKLRSGETLDVPSGIDPGWAYNVGEAAHGRPLARAAIDDANSGKWEAVPTNRDWASYGRPASVPADPAKGRLLPRAETEAEMRQALREAIGGDEVLMTDAAGGKVIVSQALIDHNLAKADRSGREQFFGLLREVVEDPYEIWISFARNAATGKYGLRRRYIKRIAVDKARAGTLVAEASEGVWTGVTYYPGRKPAQKDRAGHLVYGRPVDATE